MTLPDLLKLCDEVTPWGPDEFPIDFDKSLSRYKYMARFNPQTVRAMLEVIGAARDARNIEDKRETQGRKERTWYMVEKAAQRLDIALSHLDDVLGE